MTTQRNLVASALAIGCASTSRAFTAPSPSLHPTSRTQLCSALNNKSVEGNLHGQGSCFLPLLQNDEEYIAPRIVQIAGAYPGVTASTYLYLSSEPPAELGQWSYDFSDPNGPQLGTVALPGMTSVYETKDPVVIIAEHTSLGVSLPPQIVDPVDLIVLCDRSKRYFSERKFLVLDLEGEGGELRIAAFGRKQEVPEGATILGQVSFVQVPWLPNMQKKKSGFMEEDELF
eukprot:CCRYP_011783-RC/>CCRYP_011783-RC protein AED:0.08 eAED:0.08 QI:136/1/1/1/0.33/0.25/4/2318/229